MIRMVMAATLEMHGPQSMGIVAETGCNTVYGSTYPFNPFTVPWTNSLFENGPADAMGIRLRWDQAGHADRKLWVFGGDGAMYDIGFQSLSRLVASGMDVKVLVLDTGVYSNTGGQTSTASFAAQVSKMSAFGKAEHGKGERRKELGRIMVAHGDAYVAQVAACNINHLYKAVIEANEYPGPAVIIAYTACMPEHGIGDDMANRQAKLAVDSRAFPLFTYDPRRGASIADRLSLQGNPAVKEDWSKSPDGTTFDFISFARTEGRFAPALRQGGQSLRRAAELTGGSPRELALPPGDVRRAAEHPRPLTGGVYQPLAETEPGPRKGPGSLFAAPVPCRVSAGCLPFPPIEWHSAPQPGSSRHSRPGGGDRKWGSRAGRPRCRSFWRSCWPGVPGQRRHHRREPLRARRRPSPGLRRRRPIPRPIPRSHPRPRPHPRPHRLSRRHRLSRPRRRRRPPLS